MKLHTHPVGTLSIVVLDQHRGMHMHRAYTTDAPWNWLKEQDDEADPGTAFYLDENEWAQVAEALDLHGAVHVENRITEIAEGIR